MDQLGGAGIHAADQGREHQPSACPHGEGGAAAVRGGAPPSASDPGGSEVSLPHGREQNGSGKAEWEWLDGGSEVKLLCCCSTQNNQGCMASSR